MQLGIVCVQAAYSKYFIFPIQTGTSWMSFAMVSSFKLKYHVTRQLMRSTQVGNNYSIKASEMQESALSSHCSRSDKYKRYFI
jgi:hypothetical protein